MTPIHINMKTTQHSHPMKNKFDLSAIIRNNNNNGDDILCEDEISEGENDD